ncbi:putative ABC transport system permease protein [Thermohydrogenium kirishiense]|nr:putative ABC transport system permease protein [Thermohydrogenium kirishiense]
MAHFITFYALSEAKGMIIKMNKYLFEVISAYIKKYRSRSLAICLGIILCTALIVGVGTLADSAKHANVTKTKYESGIYHVRYNIDIDESKLKMIKNEPNVEKIGISSYYDSTVPDGRIILNIIKANKDYVQLTNSKVIKGRFPVKDDEIAIEEWVLKNMGVNPEPGTKINFNLYGKKTNETYILTGILQDRPRLKSSGQMEAILNLNENDSYKDAQVYVEFDENTDINKDIQNIAEDLKIDNKYVRKNNMLLESLGSSKKIDPTFLLISLIAGVVSLIVILGIFNISILQRLSEYGIMRAVGAGSLQILMLLFYELLTLLLISTPIGIVGGLAGAKFLSSIAGNLFTEGKVDIKNIVLSPRVFLMSIIINLISIIIVTLVTYRSIKKLTLIDSIRKNLNTDIKYKKVLIKTDFLYRILPFSKYISFRNIFRNKKSFYMIILSMCLGSTIFIISNFYAELTAAQINKEAETSKINTDYKIEIIPGTNLSVGIPFEDIQEIKNLEGIEEVKTIQPIYGRMKLKKENIAEPLYFEQINDSPYFKEVLNGLLVKEPNSDEYILKNDIYGYDDKLLKEMKKYVKKGQIDIEKMKKEKIAIIAIPHPMNTKHLSPDVVNLKVGDKITESFRKDGDTGEEFFRMEDANAQFKEEEFTVGAIVEKLIDSSDYYAGNNSVQVVISNDILQKISGFKNYRLIDINVKPGYNSEKLYNQILKIAKRTQGATVLNLSNEKQKIKAFATNQLIFINTIVIVLFAISFLNIINNVSYSLISRVNEFGMIRAVGITNKEFRKMITFEGMTYGIFSSTLSVIFGLTGQVILFKYLGPILITPKFTIDWKIYLFIVIINILLGFSATFIVSKRVKRMSIVESISTIN